MPCSLLCRICRRLSRRRDGDSLLDVANDEDERPSDRRRLRQEAADEAFARRLAGNAPQILPRQRLQSGESTNQGTESYIVSDEDLGETSDIGRQRSRSSQEAISAERCPICMEVKDVYTIAACTHFLCVRCATQYIRSALANGKAEVKAIGVRCPMHAVSGCLAAVTVEAARDLLHSPGSPGAQTQVTGSFAGPLNQEELERFERFVVEASLPHGRKVHCPKCERPAASSFTPDGNCECPYCGHTWDVAAHRGQDKATAEAVRATSKPCPNCGLHITHYHGHDCHHIQPGDGCPGCGQHFCYVCLRKHGVPGCREWHRRCTHRQTFCSATRIREHLVRKPFPHDSRCGCPICPDCSTNNPCPQCPGNCVVCQGILPPGGVAQS